MITERSFTNASTRISIIGSRLSGLVNSVEFQGIRTWKELSTSPFSNFFGFNVCLSAFNKFGYFLHSKLNRTLSVNLRPLISTTICGSRCSSFAAAIEAKTYSSIANNSESCLRMVATELLAGSVGAGGPICSIGTEFWASFTGVDSAGSGSALLDPPHTPQTIAPATSATIANALKIRVL